MPKCRRPAARSLDHRLHRHRQPDGRPEPTCSPKNAARRDADDRRRHAIHVIRLPRIAGSRLNRLFQYDQLTTATAASAAPSWSSCGPISRPIAGCSAEHREEGAHDILAVDGSRPRRPPAHLEAGRRHADQFREHVVVDRESARRTPREAVHARLAGIPAQQLDELLRFAHRQRAQHQGVEQAENGGVGADAERQRQNRHGGKNAIPSQAANRVGDVPPQIIDPSPDPDGTGVLAGERQIAQRPPAGKFRGIGR